MMSIFIISVSLITLCTSFCLFHKASGSLALSRFNTVSFVFYFSIIFSTFIGSIVVALGLVDEHYMIKLVKDSTKISAWGWVCYSMIIMPLGMIFLNNILKVNIRKRYISYLNSNIEFNYGPKLTLTFLFILFLISLITIVYIVTKSSTIPLWTALVDQNLKDALIERNINKRSFPGIIYIKNLIGLYLIPIFSYYSYIVYKIKKGVIKKTICYLFIFISVILLTYDTQKGPVVFYFLGFVIINVLLNGKISTRNFFAFVFVCMILVFAAYSITTNKNFFDLFHYKSAFFSRAFISGYAGLPLTFEWIPNVITEPTWYVGVPKFILNLFDIVPVESARLVMEQLNPAGVKAGTAGLVSSYFLAEAWANYGIIGLLISPIVVGLVVQVVHLFLISNRKDPLIIAFYAHISTHWLVQNGFVNFLFLKQLIFPFLLYFCVKLLVAFLKFSLSEKSPLS